MRRVIIESPYAGNVDLHLRYLRAAMRDCLLRGEAPFASHGLYPSRPVDPGVRVELTRGYGALVSVVDVERVRAHKWLASGRPGRVYASRNQRDGKKQRVIYLHRFLLGLEGDAEGDHRNGDRLDNRRSNIRSCTHAENGRNARRPTTNTSGFKGVATRGALWRAQIVVDGKQRHLGSSFATAEDAARAYDHAAHEHFGAFAHLNFPRPEWDGPLDDNNPSERYLGIAAGFEWHGAADATVVYVDLGISRGMRLGIDHATAANLPVEYRRLGGEWAP